MERGKREVERREKGYAGQTTAFSREFLFLSFCAAIPLMNEAIEMEA